jgi:hypothetical protein
MRFEEGEDLGQWFQRGLQNNKESLEIFVKTAAKCIPNANDKSNTRNKQAP